MVGEGGGGEGGGAANSFNNKLYQSRQQEPALPLSELKTRSKNWNVSSVTCSEAARDAGTVTTSLHLIRSPSLFSYSHLCDKEAGWNRQGSAQP